jgi:hypothetical protein
MLQPTANPLNAKHYVLFKDPTRTVQLTLCLCLKINQLLLCREIIAVYFEIRTQINTMCGQNVEFLKAKPGGR